MALWDIKIARGKKADIPQLSLGELGYVTDEEEIYIGGVNGENINITNNAQLNKSTQEINLLKKSLFPSNTSHYYVSPNGNDSNEGSSDKPFATIQHAINQIPIVCDIGMVIHVSNGSYDSFKLEGKISRGYVSIIGESTDGVIVKNFTLTANTVDCQIRNMTLNSTTEKHAIISGCSKVRLDKIKTTANTAQDEGFYVEYSNAYISGCEISNKNVAINSFIGGNILLQGCSGSGNKTALSAIYGGVIAKDNNTITGTTQENAGIGGVIR